MFGTIDSFSPSLSLLFFSFSFFLFLEANVDFLFSEASFGKRGCVHVHVQLSFNLVLLILLEISVRQRSCLYWKALRTLLLLTTYNSSFWLLTTSKAHLPHPCIVVKIGQNGYLSFLFTPYFLYTLLPRLTFAYLQTQNTYFMIEELLLR